MMSTAPVILLRLLHIVSGALWVGTVVFLAAFMMPTVRAIGPAGGAVMQQLMEVRKLSSWLMGVAMLTNLSGLVLYWNASSGFSSAWLGSGPGMTFGLGAVFGIGTAVVGMAVNAPSARRLARIAGEVRASGAAPSASQVAEMQRLQGRMGTATRIAAALLLLATAAMASARYMPS